MSVLRRLYNVAYGKVRTWQSDDLDIPLESSRIESSTRSEGGAYTSGAGEAVERLREQLGRLQAEAELGRRPPRRREEDEPEVARPEPPETPEQPAQPAGPRQRTL
jgi:hypothetical protein